MARPRAIGLLIFAAWFAAVALGGCTLFVAIDPDLSDGTAIDGGADAGGEAGRVDTGDEGGLDAASDVLTHDAGDACPPPIASDSFSREGIGGFGPADVGGHWTVSDKGNASVSAGMARVAMNAGAGSEAVLDQLAVLDVDETFVFTTDKPCAPSDGGASGIFVYLNGRKTSAGSYWIGLWLTESNTVRLGLTRLLNGKEDSLELSPDVFGITYTAGMRLRVRARFEGVSPTKISGRVWKDGESEPAAWTVEATDSTPELQAPGALAIKAYLSIRATNAPVTVTFDDFVARPPGSCTN